MNATSSAPVERISGPVELNARVSSSPDDGKGGPRQQWIDVSFVNAPVTLSYISFHNYYCASITISHTSMRAEGDPLMQLHMKGRAPTWQVVVPKLALMAAAHHEDDAQSYHELSALHFAPEFDHRRVTRLRICCLQPSPMWREYGLRDLKFYSIEPPAAPSLLPPPSLSTTERELAATILDHVVDLAHVAQQIRQTIAAGKAASICADAAAGGSRANARRAERELVPYVVGEFSDELRLCSLDAATASSAASSGSKAGSGGACGGMGMLERRAAMPPRDHTSAAGFDGMAPT